MLRVHTVHIGLSVYSLSIHVSAYVNAYVSLFLWRLALAIFLLVRRRSLQSLGFVFMQRPLVLPMPPPNVGGGLNSGSSRPMEEMNAHTKLTYVLGVLYAMSTNLLSVGTTECIVAPATM